MKCIVNCSLQTSVFVSSFNAVSVGRSGVAVQCARIFATIESKIPQRTNSIIFVYVIIVSEQQLSRSTCGLSGVGCGLCVNFIGALLHGTSMCSVKQACVPNSCSFSVVKDQFLLNWSSMGLSPNKSNNNSRVNTSITYLM